MTDIHAEFYDRERAHHDDWAASTNAAELDYRAHFTVPTAPENRWILEQLGDVTGKKILDIGGGLGENALFFASRGAQVTASDLSQGMVDKALEAAALHGMSDRIEGRVLNAMDLDVPDETYDIVYAANILHHLPDPEVGVAEMARVLKPGGVFCSWDPLKHNPVINVYRRMATDVRSEDEFPLSYGFANRIRPHFQSVQRETFWLSALTIFLKLYFIERRNPNEHRYWKVIINEHERYSGWYRRCAALDRLFRWIPGMKALSWNMALVARK